MAAGTGRLSKLAALLLAAGVALQALPAAALDGREAGQVVAILEKLAAETGDGVYFDEEAAEEWFEIDEESSRLISGAGFTRATWKTAFDRTMTGFIASIPQAEMEKMMEDFMDAIGEVAKMTPGQKEEAMEMLRAEKGNLDSIRARGAEYREPVGPYVSRLRKVALHK